MTINLDIFGQLLSPFLGTSKIISVKKLKKGRVNFVFLVCISNPKRFLIAKCSVQQARFYSNNPENCSSLEREQFVMELLNKHSIPVPRVHYLDTSRVHSSFDCLLMDKLRGFNLADLWPTLNQYEQYDIAQSMGQLLAQLHELRLAGFGDIGRQGVLSDCQTYPNNSNSESKSGTTWYDYIVPESLLQLSRLISCGYCEMDFANRAEELIVSHCETFQRECIPTLIHNDFWFENILVKKRNERWIISGLLDFEISFSGAKEFDFTKLCRWHFQSTPILKHGLMKGYNMVGELRPDVEKLIRVYTVMSNLGFINRLIKMGNKVLARKILGDTDTLTKKSFRL